MKADSRISIRFLLPTNWQSSGGPSTPDEGANRAPLNLDPKSTFKTSDIINVFTCQSGKMCKVKCWGEGGTLDEAFTSLVVYQFKEHNYRLWLALDAGNFLIGMNQTCKFDGVSSVPPIPPTETPPNQPGNPCIGPNCPKR